MDAVIANETGIWHLHDKVGASRFDKAHAIPELGQVTVQYVDTKTGVEETIVSGMVIAADGIHSTVRELMGVPVRKEYAGYVAWRGTVSEDMLAPSTLGFFRDRMSFVKVAGTYFVGEDFSHLGGVFLDARVPDPVDEAGAGLDVAIFPFRLLSLHPFYSHHFSPTSNLSTPMFFLWITS